MEKKYISTNAAKNPGIEFPMKLKNRITKSIQRFFFTAERIPKGRAIRIVKRSETAARRRVAGSFAAKDAATS